MKGLRYTLVLEEPLLANSRAGDSNSARSLPYVPGGLVRGALIHAYLHKRGLAESDAAEPEFRHLFFSGQTRYLHAYPSEQEFRALPAPLSWKVSKDDNTGETGTAFNLAKERPLDPDLEAFPVPLWWQRGQTAYGRETVLQFNLHTQRDAVLGRAQEGLGAVFRFEALAAGQRLQGVILTETDQDTATLEFLLNSEELLLGKARTGGYGRVRVARVERLPEDWREGWHWEEENEEDDEEDFGNFEETPQPLSQFTLTFVSAGLVRDNHGQFTLDPRHALQTRLGDVKLKETDVYRQMEIVGGFNRTWGLPLPQVTAIAPGSVFVYNAEPAVSLPALRQLEETGLGERRAEGFGRIVIDTYQPALVNWWKLERDEESDRDEDSSKPELSDSAKAVARLMLTRLLRRELDEACLAKAQELSIQGNIPNSQLARWRVIVRDTLSQGTPTTKLQRLVSFFSLQKTKHRLGWRAMERARIGFGQEKQRLAEWIDELLTGNNSPWRQLGYGGNPPVKKLVEAATPEQPPDETLTVKPDDELTMEYKLRLLDAVLAAKSKQNKKNGESDA